MATRRAADCRAPRHSRRRRPWRHNDSREQRGKNAVLEVLHEDAHLLIVVKHAGLATQGRPGCGPDLEAEVRSHLRPDDPAQAYVGTVHRLDRPVSGVILWAKPPKAARRVAEQFASRHAHKEYWAIVEGAPDAAAGTWDN